MREIKVGDHFAVDGEVDVKVVAELEPLKPLEVEGELLRAK
jgi:hypothetical protein